MSLSSGNSCAAAGFMFIAVTATIGAYRFSQLQPSTSLFEWHLYMAWLSTALGLPLIAASYLYEHHSIIASCLVLSGVIVMLLGSGVLTHKMRDVAAQALGGIAMVSVFLCSVLPVNGFGILGTTMFVIAFLAVKVDGELWGWQRVDIFHYVCVVAVFALMKGLQ